MPYLVDPLKIKNGSTEVDVLSTALVFKNVTLEDVTFGTDCAHYVETGTTSASLVNYGLSILAGSSTGAPNVYTLAAPDAGVEKAIYVTLATSSDTVTVNVTTSVAVGTLATTDAKRNIVFSSPGLIKLYGLSTSQWAVVSLGSTLVGTTALPTLTT